MIINIELIEIWLFKWPIIQTQDDQFYSLERIFLLVNMHYILLIFENY